MGQNRGYHREGKGGKGWLPEKKERRCHFSGRRLVLLNSAKDAKAYRMWKEVTALGLGKRKEREGDSIASRRKRK